MGKIELGAPMNHVLTSFSRSFPDLWNRKVILKLFLPFVLSFVFWSLVTWLGWEWILSLGFKLYNSTLMQGFVTVIAPYFTLTEDPLVAVTAAVFILAVILPSALITAIFVASLILVPIMVESLRSKEFAHLHKKSNSIFAGTGTSLVYSLKYAAMWIATLPLWLIVPGGAILVPFFLLSWFNSRLFAWESLIEVTDPVSARHFLINYTKPLFFLGILTSSLYLIPVLNILAPSLSAAAYARFCLTQIDEDQKRGSDKKI